MDINKDLQDIYKSKAAVFFLGTLIEVAYQLRGGKSPKYSLPCSASLHLEKALTSSPRMIPCSNFSEITSSVVYIRIKDCSFLPAKRLLATKE